MKINKLFSFLLGGALIMGAASCTDEVEYNGADAITGNGVYFPELESTDVAIEQNTSSVTVELLRTNGEAQLNVPLKSSVTDKDGNAVANNPFDIPATVTFPAGVVKIQVPISYVFTDVEPEFNYYVHLAIEGEESTPYGRVNQTYVLKYAPWSDFELYNKSTEPAVCTYTLFGIDDREVPVYVSKSLIGAGFKYRFGDWGCLPEEQEEEEVSFVNGRNLFLTVEKDPIPAANAPGKIANRFYPAHMEPFISGDANSWGSMIYTTDVYTYRMEYNPGIYPANTDEELRNISYYDSETGLFTIYTMWFAIDEATTKVQYTREYYQLPGFKDYSIEFSYNGNFVDTKGNEYAMVEAHRSDDVASFAYTISAGELTNDQIETEVAAIQANSDAELYFDAVTNLQFSLDEGVYTIVGVGYDSTGKAVCNTAYAFQYSSVQKASDWETVSENAEFTDGILWGTLQYTDGTFVGGDTYSVKLERHKTETNRYRIVNPYAPYYDLGIIADGDYYLNFVLSEDGTMGLIETCALGIVANQNGMWYATSMLSGLLEEGYTIEQIAQALPQYSMYFGRVNDGCLQFGASMLGRCYESQLAQGRFYLANFNEAYLEALDMVDAGLLSEEVFNQNVDNLAYGYGLFKIDVYDAIYGAPAHRSLATKAARNTHHGKTVVKRTKDSNVKKAVASMPGHAKAKAAKRINVNGKKVDGQTILKGRTTLPNKL